MLYLAVFSSGMTTLAVELTASRLLGNVFGTTNLVWANVIGLMLLYLTVGYFVGGRIADRYPQPIAFYRIILWGAFFSGLVPIVAQPVLYGAANAVAGFQAGVALGSFGAVLVLFAVPVTLLGCISPFAIRLAVVEVQDAGKIAGRMYAISTMGSLVGTFLPVLYLIPEAGTTRTFLYFAWALIVVGLIGLLNQGRAGRRVAFQLIWMPLVLLILGMIALNKPLRPPPEGTNLLWERDSAYNYIQVVERSAPVYRWPAGTRELHLNEGQGIHSIWSPAGGFYGGTWDIFLAVPFFNAPPYRPEDVQSLCVIGLAAGTITTQYADVFGARVQMDGIEIDAEIIEAGRKFFGMNQPNLRVIVEDGRLGLRNSGRSYDVVAIDAYRVPYVPWHLTTVEFFAEVRAKLTAKGVVAINVGRIGGGDDPQGQDRRLVDAMTNTMQRVFPSVYTIDVPDSFNTILVGTTQRTSPANVRDNLAGLPSSVSPLLKQSILTTFQALRPNGVSDILFTDDRAPVETIINSMLINFFTGGGAQELAR